MITDRQPVSTLSRPVALVVIALVVIPLDAHAYIDPVTGSLIIQGVIGAIAAMIATAGRLLPAWRRWFTLAGLLHITLQGSARSVASSDAASTHRPPQLPKPRYRVLLTEMRRLVAGQAFLIHVLFAIRAPWADPVVHDDLMSLPERLRTVFGDCLGEEICPAAVSGLDEP